MWQYSNLNRNFSTYIWGENINIVKNANGMLYHKLLSNNKWKPEWITERFLSQGDACNKYFHWNTSPWVSRMWKICYIIAEHLEHWISEAGILIINWIKNLQEFQAKSPEWATLEPLCVSGGIFPSRHLTAHSVLKHLEIFEGSKFIIMCFIIVNIYLPKYLLQTGVAAKL